MTRILFLFLFLFGIQSANAQATKAPLFSKGAETFALKDKAGKVPSFIVLDDSPTERTLATIVIAALNSDPKVQPKISMSEKLNLKVESLELAPSIDGPDKLVVSVKLSGREVELNRPVDKTKFLTGQPISIDFPESSKNMAFFEVNSSGRLKFRLNTKTNDIVIDEARAKSTYTMGSGEEGTETISFSGIGTRVAKQ